MTAAESAGRRPDVPALTGLRFLAAFSVLLAHGLSATLTNNEPPEGAVLWLMQASGFGMTLFFVLSLCDPLQLRPLGDRRPAARHRRLPLGALRSPLSTLSADDACLRAGEPEARRVLDRTSRGNQRDFSGVAVFPVVDTKLDLQA